MGFSQNLCLENENKNLPYLTTLSILHKTISMSIQQFPLRKSKLMTAKFCNKLYLYLCAIFIFFVIRLAQQQLEVKVYNVYNIHKQLTEGKILNEETSLPVSVQNSVHTQSQCIFSKRDKLNTMISYTRKTSRYKYTKFMLIFGN